MKPKSDSETAWKCSSCGALRLNPLCRNCRACGKPKYEVETEPMPRTQKPRPWIRHLRNTQGDSD
eukprot:1456211-Alexandrium_andersonii.AAC.1